MHLTSLSITSATALNFDLTPSAPVCILRGRHSDLALDLIRELMGDYGAQNDPDRVDDGRPVFLYGFLDRLDAATDISPLIDRLASLGRQVFIAVCSDYQASHNLIHMTETEDSYVKS